MLSHRATSDVSAPEAICTLDNLPRNDRELLRVTHILIPRADQPRSVTTHFAEEEQELQSPAEGFGNGSAQFRGSLLPGGVLLPLRRDAGLQVARCRDGCPERGSQRLMLPARTC